MHVLALRHAIRRMLWGAAMLLSPAVVLAQLQAGTVCGANGESEPSPATDTASACEMHRAFPDPLDPTILHQGTGRAAAQVAYGVLKVRATAEGEGGEASALGFAEVNSSFAILSTDAAREGEMVYVTFGAHRVDGVTQREALVPRPDGEIVSDYSFAATTLRNEFDMFTTLSGATLQWRWSDEGLERQGAGTEHDFSSHEVLGDLAPRIVPMFLGELASFRWTLLASANVQGSGQAVVDAFQSAYWGGITGVVDAAGRPVDYTVRSPEGADWGRSHVPGVAAPVPEPASALLFGLGAAVLALGQRRKTPRTGVA